MKSTSSQNIPRPYYVAGVRHRPAAEALARRICSTPSRLPGIQARLLHDAGLLSSNHDRFYADCETLVTQADAFQKSMLITATDLGMSEERRLQCNTLMYAAKFDVPLVRARAAAEGARNCDPQDLIQALLADAATALSFAYGLGIVAETHTSYITALGAGAVKAWKAGTVASKVKAAGLALGAAGVTTVASGVVVGLALAATAIAKQSDMPRRRAYATQAGKDLAFVELITGRRYVSQAADFNLPGESINWTRFPEGHGGR